MIKKLEKTCGKCKQVFPLTNDNFHTKVTKKGTIINGKPLLNDSVSFRSTCRTCHNKKTSENCLKKRMLKNNITSKDEYNSHVYNTRVKCAKMGTAVNIGKPSKKRKYVYPENSTLKEIQKIRQIKDKGYEPETYQIDWKKDWLKKMHMLRKYDYNTNNDKLSSSEINKMQRLYLTDAILANSLGFRLSEVPKDILELKRKQLIIYRTWQNLKNQ